MLTLGEELRRRREERGITLADISESTRIGTRFLKAIETDNYGILPGGIFTRSFIRAYAKQVGLNEDEAIGLYQQQIAGPGGEPVMPADPEPRAREPVLAEQRVRRIEPLTYRSSSAPRTSWANIVIVIGIFFIFGLIIFALVRKFGAGEPPRQAANNGAAAEQSAPPQAAPEPNQNAPAQPAEPAPVAAEPQQPVSVGAGEPLVVKLEAAAGDSWIRYEVDGVKGPPILLKQGQTQDIPPAQSQVKINTGNRQALKVTINNREAVIPAATPKTVAQLVISRENLQTYFQ